MINSYNEWRILYVKSRHEKKVHDLLLESSIESYLPLVKIIRLWSDRKKMVELPLFPNYVFVKTRSSKDSYKATSVNGAFSYIRFGAEYAVITEEEINKIKFITGLKDVFNIEKETQQPLKIGKKRRIKFGAYNNVECEILRTDKKSKVLVNIGSLKQNIIATVPSHYFEI